MKKGDDSNRSSANNNWSPLSPLQKEIMWRKQMNSKHVFLRYIGLMAALLLALTPLVQVHSQDVPRNKSLIIGFEGGPAPAPENAGLNATALTSQGPNQIMIESLWILNYQTGKSDPWLASGPEKWNSDYTV